MAFFAAMSRSLTAREMVTHALVEALLEHASTLDDAFAARHLSRLPASQRAMLGKPSLIALAAALEAQEAAVRFGDASAIHDAELADDEGPLRVLDSCTQHLFELLSRLRRSVMTMFGDDALRAVRLDSRMVTHPIMLLGQAKKTRDALLAGALERLVPLDASLSMDVNGWIDLLDQVTDSTEKAMAEVSREVGEARVSLENKLDAARAADGLIVNARELVAALFHAAGLDELSAQIVPMG